MKKNSAEVYSRIFDFLGVDQMDIQTDDRAKNVNPFAYSRLCNNQMPQDTDSNSLYHRIVEKFKPQVELLQHLSAHYSHGIPQVEFSPIEGHCEKMSHRKGVFANLALHELHHLAREHNDIQEANFAMHCPNDPQFRKCFATSRACGTCCVSGEARYNASYMHLGEPLVKYRDYMSNGNLPVGMLWSGERQEDCWPTEIEKAMADECCALTLDSFFPEWSLAKLPAALVDTVVMQ